MSTPDHFNQDTAPSTGRRRSVIGDLAAKRQKRLTSLEMHQPVPRWDDPELVVIYRPVSEEWRASKQKEIDKLSGQRRAKAEFDLNCDLLIQHCVGVYAKDPDDPEARLSLHPDGEDMPLTRFDQDLARTGKVEPQPGKTEVTARDVLRFVYLTDGDILSTSAAVIRWSGYEEQKAEEAELGE